jgi:hypothetical protein
MRQLRVLIVLVPTLALCAGTSSAIATEAGFLPLAALKGVIDSRGASRLARLAGASIVVACLVDVIANRLGKAGQTHVTSGTVTIEFKECKETKGKTEVACSSENAKGEKDAKEVVLMQEELHTVNLLSESTLEPGVAFSLSEPAKLTCGGVSKVEFKGTALGAVKVSSLSADVSTLNFVFVSAGETCDKGETTCEKYKEGGLLVNATGTFEKATEETEEEDILEGEEGMVLVDD